MNGGKARTGVRGVSAEKVLLKFYLLHSNLAVRISNEDRLAIAPALIAIPVSSREDSIRLIGVGAVVLSVAKVSQDLNEG